MKVERLHLERGPVLPICRRPAIWAGCSNRESPIVYLQRPKWIKSDESWDLILRSIRIELPKGAEIK